MIEKRKHILLSKTVVVALIQLGAARLSPGLAKWVSENPEVYAEIIAFLMISLRYVTNSSVRITKEGS